MTQFKPSNRLSYIIKIFSDLLSVQRMPPPPTTHDLILRGKSHLHTPTATGARPRTSSSPPSPTTSSLHPPRAPPRHFPLAIPRLSPRPLRRPPATAAQADACLAAHERAYALPATTRARSGAARAPRRHRRRPHAERRPRCEDRCADPAPRRLAQPTRRCPYTWTASARRCATTRTRWRRREAVEARSAALEAEYCALVEAEQRLRSGGGRRGFGAC